LSQQFALRALVRKYSARYVAWRTFSGIVGWATFRFQGLTGTLGVLREIRDLSGALQRLSVATQALVRAQNEHGPATDVLIQVGLRLDELERSRSIWEADVEAEFTRAESKYKAAAAAAERARKANETRSDHFDIDSEELETPVPADDAPPFPAEGVQPLHLDLAPVDRKTNALRYKYL